MRAQTQEQWKETSPSHRQAKTLSALLNHTNNGELEIACFILLGIQTKFNAPCKNRKSYLIHF
jgi:hypothetical protein